MNAPTAFKVCHRYRVESAADRLEMGRLWPREVREETLRRVRSLPTYDRATDTVVVCWYVSRPPVGSVADQPPPP